MALSVAGVAVADTRMGAIVRTEEADPIVGVPTFDAFDIPCDFTQHGAAPQDLGSVHSTIS